MVEDREMRVIRDQLKRNRIHMYFGIARFADRRTVTVESDNEVHTLTADNFLIACGTHPARSNKYVHRQMMRKRITKI